MMDDIELRIEEVKRLRDLLSRAASYLDELRDEGPDGCNWKSKGLLLLLSEIDAALDS